MADRATNIEESEMLEAGAEMQVHATKYIAAFTAFDAGLDAAWLTAWSAAYTEAEDTTDDETYLDQITGKTAEVVAEVTVCKRFLHDLKYYAERTWETEDANYRIFRFPKLHTFASSVPRFITYCRTCHAHAVKNAAALAAFGLPGTVTPLFLSAINSLTDADTAQELFNTERLLNTQERRKKFNTFYSFMQRTNSAASNIYRGKPEMLKLFDLPTPKKKKEEV